MRRVSCKALTCILGAFTVACGEMGGEPSACDGLAERRMVITREEYTPCAAEMIAALHRLRPAVEEVLAGDAEARSSAKEALQALRGLVRKSGVEADTRSVRTGELVERWPDGRMRAFNHSVFDALVQYGAVLQYPNEDNFREGIKAQDGATEFYRMFR
jgi:hypothetical protein